MIQNKLKIHKFISMKLLSSLINRKLHYWKKCFTFWLFLGSFDVMNSKEGLCKCREHIWDAKWRYNMFWKVLILSHLPSSITTYHLMLKGLRTKVEKKFEECYKMRAQEHILKPSLYLKDKKIIICFEYFRVFSKNTAERLRFCC